MGRLHLTAHPHDGLTVRRQQELRLAAMEGHRHRQGGAAPEPPPAAACSQAGATAAPPTMRSGSDRSSRLVCGSKSPVPAVSGKPVPARAVDAGRAALPARPGSAAALAPHGMM